MTPSLGVLVSPRLKKGLLALEDGHVFFRWKDYTDDHRTKVMQLTADEFIRRFLLHVLPKRFVRIRQVGTGPGSVAVADFNNDGNPDVVTANLSDGTVSVLPGNGDGSFGPALTLPVGPLPGSVAVGDFAGTGDVGIVTADAGAGGSISLLAGNGDGTLLQTRNQLNEPALWSAIEQLCGVLLGPIGNALKIVIPSEEAKKVVEEAFQRDPKSSKSGKGIK